MRITALWVAAALATCAAVNRASAQELRPFGGIQSLITEPQRWNGARVSLSGFLFVDPEGDVLCTGPGDSQGVECMSVVLADSYAERSNRFGALSGRMVYLEGTFKVFEEDPRDQCRPPTCFVFPARIEQALTDISIVALVQP